MDAVLLSRIQFALTAGFHFIFPPLTLGVSLVIVILESLYLKKGDEIYKTISSFVIKILGLIFSVGVATGIVLEFSFGTNWSNYSRMVGDIFGAPLAAEGIFSFFLESVFIGILLFGRKKVSKRVYLLSAVLVAFASHLSGLWIIIANSWMQTPAGYTMADDRAVLTNFFDAALNHSTIVRYVHVILASWITGTLFLSGISAYYLIKERFQEYFRPLLKISLIIFSITAIIMLGSGHGHSVQVAKKQPEKMAAFEALWKTQTHAPMSIIGIPSPAEKKTYLEIAIPGLLSGLIHLDMSKEVKGLDAFPENDLPPIVLPYLTYHAMVGLGMLYVLAAFVSILLLITKKLYDKKFFLKLLMVMAPLPLISNEVGWISAEVGRQPWAVYRVLRTADAASVSVPAGQILFSLIVFGLIYILLFLVFLVILKKIISKGPDIAADQKGN